MKITHDMVVKAVLHYKPFFGLTDWSFEVDVEQLTEDGPMSAVHPQPTLENFVLGFNSRKFPPTEEYASEEEWYAEFRRMICHELEHVKNSQWVETYERKLRDLMGADAGQDFINYMYNMEDKATDRTARTLRTYLPKFTYEETI